MKGVTALTIMALAILGVSSRPSPQLRQLETSVDLQDLPSSEELLDSVEELGGLSTGPHPRETLLAPDSAQMPPNHTWLRLFSDFMNHQKKFRGRTKKSWMSHGCFGMKLERIGSRSGLGC